MHPLNPLTLNLHGQILIEASAGTGKTYTIALLFLRLLLEKGLSVDEILVVTFTRAATEELRGRIRQRIRDALDVLEGQGPDDPLLRELLDRSVEAVGPDRAAVLLGDALTRMDEAAIYTIHGFCRLMLQEHAFESGAPFAMEFLETEQVLRRRIIEDFWRLRFYPASEEEAAWVASLWETPESLLAGLGGHLGRKDVECIPAVSEAEVVRQTQEAAALFAEVRSRWQQHGEEITALLRENKRLSRNNSTGYGLTRLDTAIDTLENFLAAEHMPWSAAKELDLFTAVKVWSCLKKKSKEEPPDHPFFALFEAFHQAHQQLNQDRRVLVLLTARSYLQSELVRRKQEQDQLSFDDLLTRLEAALQGEGGKRLARRIGRRFPVILVDEFQDTDPLQYRIFAAVHKTHKTMQEGKERSDLNERPGLFLIGDPKQAIYSFRGADIFTYIQARQDTLPENRLTMTTNYRSAAAMVKAVNRIFSHAAPFLFSKDEIDFPVVQAAGLADSTPLLQDKPPAALTCLLLPDDNKGKPLAKGTAEELAARFCAHEIADLLAAGQSGRAHIGDQPLCAGYIAVLVRTHAEADLIRKELSVLSITSVAFSQDSVFAGKEARQLLTLMTALNDLSDSALIRTALSTDLFGYTAEKIEHLRLDEQAWEEVMQQMADYQRIWHIQGVIPMLQKLLKDQQTVSRLCALPGGERMLTNFLHLAELLQEESRQRKGADALLRRFSDQIHSPEKNAENQQLRLESDEDLVQIVTIHKSKGMEYPVVFLPFLWAARPCSPDRPLAFHRPEQPDRLCIDFRTGREESDEHFRLAEKERLAEDLRLLYVALTRARYCCFFCWGRINKMEESALCYLLHGGMSSPEQLAADLRQAGNGAEEMAVKPFPERFVRPDLSRAAAGVSLSAKPFTGRIDSRWQLFSYSGLTALHRSDTGLQPERPDYDEEAGRDTVEEPEMPEPDAFSFPKGAAAGTCLHAILEHISFHDPNGHEAVISAQLARAGFAATWQPVVSSWMQAVLHTGLQVGEGQVFSLSELEDTARVNEMAFYFPLVSMQAGKFNRVMRGFSYAPLPEQSGVLEGLMVGFIDLVFRCNGRYYLADYKSNYLGSRPEAYQQDQLRAAMLEHRYDLQYLIYTLALHRFLQQRIRNYDYAEHFGGVLYLFLRGMHPDHEPGTGVFSARPPFALIDALNRVVKN
ncbi:MAG: exodeoxyribonuclease V subunit beta [Candidatus Electrothrix sp. YB6]